MRPAAAAVFAAIKAAADERGRVIADQNTLAQLTGLSPAVCGNARQELYRMKVLRRVGFSVPSIIQLMEPSR